MESFIIFGIKVHDIASLNLFYILWYDCLVTLLQFHTSLNCKECYLNCRFNLFVDLKTLVAKKLSMLLMNTSFIMVCPSRHTTLFQGPYYRRWNDVVCLLGQEGPRIFSRIHWELFSMFVYEYLPNGICLLKVNNGNTRIRWSICSKLTPCSSVSIVNLNT